MGEGKPPPEPLAETHRRSCLVELAFRTYAAYALLDDFLTWR
jgi:hypothetical protein